MSNEKIKALLDENEKAAEAQEELANAKIDFSMKALAILLTTVDDRFKELLEGMAGTEHFDKELGKGLQETISQAMQTFLQVKHEINFQPQINLDLAPIKSEITRGIEQSKSLYGLIDKMDKNGGKNEALYNLIVLMINKAMASYDRIININISPDLKEINTTLSQRPEKWKGKVTKRITSGILNGAIDEFEIEVIK